MISDLLFYLIGALTIVSAIAVVSISNPIYCALLLVLTMLGVSGLFFTLEAYFVAAAQLIIYAGAVMVLFVMVVMLFNLKEEKNAFSKGTGAFLVKMAASGFILGVMVSGVIWTAQYFQTPELQTVGDGMKATKGIALHLFSNYLMAFEVIGVLLLVVLVGAIALARSKGGTHAS
ncbi:MAG: NADH-quinone oxidoreductase subunit J [Bdellovibrionales bacterium]|nr:NADH-quinone oxidoreductase subunit J [Bdellovibrionales bacterium]